MKTLKAYFDCSWSTLLREHLSLVPTTTVRLKIRSAREVKRYVDVTEQSLFKEIKRVWDALGRRPSYSEFKRMSSIGISVYEHRFGNWKSAIARFYSQNSQGLIGLAGSHATPHLLLTELRRIVCESRSHILTYNNYRSFGGTYSIGAFQAHFGSWQAAVEKIGYLDGHSSQFKDEELFSELQRLWEMYGRQPTYKEMDKVGKVSGGVFQRRFGSWMKAIHAFCQDRASFDDGNGHEEGDSPEVPPVVDTKATPPLVGSTPISETASIEPVRALENSILVDARRNPGKRLRWRIFEKDSFQCVVCGRGPRNHPGTVLHIDHIIPWASGGLTIFENLQTLCFDCNLGKSDRFAE